VKWRLSKGVSTFTPQEIAFYEQRRTCEPFKTEDQLELGKGFRDRDIEEVFASSIVASTIDSLDLCPDVFVDMLVVDEASQVDFIELFKVFLKVFRSRGHKDIAARRPLTVMFTGDSRQLRPYYRVFSEKVQRAVARERLGSEVLTPWHCRSAFEVIENQVRRKTTLTIQRRMNRSIGEFVQEIFYSDQKKWTYVKEPIPDAISCIDVRWGAEREDTSLFNEGEIKRAVEIAKMLGAYGRVAVLQPFTRRNERELRVRSARQSCQT
jgi:hypothetical protein